MEPWLTFLLLFNIVVGSINLYAGYDTWEETGFFFNSNTNIGITNFVTAIIAYQAFTL